MTITYYQSNTADGTTWAGLETTAGHWTLKTTTAASGTVTASWTGIASRSFQWLTEANNPNSADWPNGAFNTQVDINAIGADMAVTNLKFVRVTADGATASQAIASTTGEAFNWTTTGLHARGLTANFAAGLASDRFGIDVVANQTNTHKSQTLTFNVNTVDEYADGPWVVDVSYVGAFLSQEIPSATPPGWKAIGFNIG